MPRFMIRTKGFDQQDVLHPVQVSDELLVRLLADGGIYGIRL